MYSILGGTEVRVPHGVDVRVSNFALLGGNGVELGDEVPPAGGPVVHIRLVSILGGTGVKRGRKLSKRDSNPLGSLVMDLEEKSLDEIGDRCEECGAKLTKAEIQAALESGGPALCTVHAEEFVSVGEDEEFEDE